MKYLKLLPFLLAAFFLTNCNRNENSNEEERSKFEKESLISDQIRGKFKDPRTAEIVTSITWVERDEATSIENWIRFYEEIIETVWADREPDPEIVTLLNGLRESAKVTRTYELGRTIIRSQNSFGAFSEDAYFIIKINDEVIAVEEAGKFYDTEIVPSTRLPIDAALFDQTKD